MPLTREKKEAIVKDLNTGLDGIQSAVFVNFHGLTVSETSALRKTLKQGNTAYKVAKKTLLTKVLSEKGYTGELPTLSGEVAIAYTQGDQVFPAKTIFGFMKGKEEKLIMLGGVLEGRYLAKDEVIALAKIPSRDVLYGQLANVLLSPIQGFHGVCSNTLSGFVRALDAIAAKK
jgi:large subunit ribosomal protein L10